MDKIVVDLGLGDSGKGITVARISKDHGAVVKYTGGAQCAHNVIKNGVHHTFSQFGSGTFNGVPTIITEGFLVDLPALVREGIALERMGWDAFNMIAVSEDALLITDVAKQVGQIRELGLRHGSTGRGIYTTAQYDIDTGAGPRVKDLFNFYGLVNKIAKQARHFGMSTDAVAQAQQLITLRNQIRVGPTQLFIDEARAYGDLVFEGSQGILLDEEYGFFPHVTRADTTANKAMKYANDPEIYGVMRTYMTRHGAGPLLAESIHVKELHNGTGRFQGAFRFGNLDVEAIRYAIQCQSIDRLVVTHADHKFRMAHTEPYEYVSDLNDRAAYTKSLFERGYKLGRYATPENIETEFGMPVAIVGTGPDISQYERG